MPGRWSLRSEVHGEPGGVLALLRLAVRLRVRADLQKHALDVRMVHRPGLDRRH